MSLAVAVPRHAHLGEGFSRQEQVAAGFHPGRRTDGSQSAASWICDLTDTRKLITLCGFCARHFNPKRHGYRRFYVPDQLGITDGYACSGVCDACKEKLVATGIAFVSEEAYQVICIDPVEARRRARMRARSAQSVWSEVNRRWGSRQPRVVATGKGV